MRSLKKKKLEMGEWETSEQASFKQPNAFFLWSASWNSPIYFCFDQLHETSHCIISCLLLWDLNLSDDDFDKVPSYLPCSSSHTKLKENKLLSDFFFDKSSSSKVFDQFVSNLMSYHLRTLNCIILNSELPVWKQCDLKPERQ